MVFVPYRLPYSSLNVQFIKYAPASGPRRPWRTRRRAGQRRGDGRRGARGRHALDGSETLEGLALKFDCQVRARPPLEPFPHCAARAWLESPPA